MLNLSSSYIDLLAQVYPEYDWLPWRFEQCPRFYWHDMHNVRKFMQWAGKQLNVKEMSDWYNVSTVVKLAVIKFKSFSRN